MCREAPAAIRTQLQGFLQEYEDLFPATLPKGRPPKRAVEFEINTEEGSTPPSRPPYWLSPKEHEELQAQINDLLTQGHIRPSSSPYGTPVLFVPKKDGRWRMCVDYKALNRQTIRDRYPVVCGQAIATGTLYITLVTILARTEPIMRTGTNGNDTG